MYMYIYIYMYMPIWCNWVRLGMGENPHSLHVDVSFCKPQSGGPSSQNFYRASSGARRGVANQKHGDITN